MVNRDRSVQKIASIVVTYNPDERFLQTVSKIISQSDKVFIIDNSSPPAENIFCEVVTSKVSLHRNRSNIGLAAALNQGIIKALDEGFEWIATFDQDSLICDQYFKKLFNGLSKRNNNHRIAVITGIHLDYLTKTPLNPKKTDRQSSFIPLAISSGNLIHANTFKKIGFFDESLFIDYIDHDFCFRLRKNNFKILEIQTAPILHQLGDSRWHRIGPLTFMSTHHSPLRRYFISRNRVKIYWRHWKLDPRWVLRDIGNLGKEIAKIVLAEDQKILKISYIFLGILQLRISINKANI